MKLYTMTKYRWSADLYMPVEQQTGAPIYTLQRKVYFDMNSGAAQTYVYSKEPIPWAGMLLLVTNAKGQRPYFLETGDINMYVTSSSPVFDIYGNVTGYQQVIMRNPPNKWEDAALPEVPVEDDGAF